MMHYSHPGRRAQRVLLSLLLGLGLQQVALADDERATPRVPLLPQYQQECAACHMAYPPGLLPAASWRRLLGNLPRHYGTDASLDAATLGQLERWLTANAGTYKRVREAPPQERITRSPWFLRKHDEIAPATWKLAQVKSASNCIACHTRADQGDFNERYIRIPR